MDKRYLPRALHDAAEVVEAIRNRTAKAPAQPEAKSWFRITNVSEASTDIYIYDEISYWGITAQDFIEALVSVKTPAINLHLNSPGGDVFDGIAIHSALSNHPANVTVYVDGLAASIASVIAMAGDTVIISESAMMMIHQAMGLAMGNAVEMRTMAAVLDQIDGVIAATYAKRTGTPADTWLAAMTAETWYSGTSAVEAGLADAVAGAVAEGDGEPVVVGAEDDEPGAMDWADKARRGELVALGIRGPLDPEQPLDIVDIPDPWETFTVDALRRLLTDDVPSGAVSDDDGWKDYDPATFRDALKGAGK